jgi:hypothetical protein
MLVPAARQQRLRRVAVTSNTVNFHFTFLHIAADAYAGVPSPGMTAIALRSACSRCSSSITNVAAALRAVARQRLSGFDDEAEDRHELLLPSLLHVLDVDFDFGLPVRHWYVSNRASTLVSGLSAERFVPRPPRLFESTPDGMALRIGIASTGTGGGSDDGSSVATLHTCSMDRTGAAASRASAALCGGFGCLGSGCVRAAAAAATAHVHHTCACPQTAQLELAALVVGRARSRSTPCGSSLA